MNQKKLRRKESKLVREEEGSKQNAELIQEDKHLKETQINTLNENSIENLRK